jgi:hypothetical protein
MVSSLYKVSWAHDADGIAAMSFGMGTHQRWPEAVMIRHCEIETDSALLSDEDALLSARARIEKRGFPA